MKFEVLARRSFEDVGMRIIEVEGHEETFWLTGEDIGAALGFDDGDPASGVHKIYQRHQDELKEFSMLWPVETPGGPREVRIFSEEAVYLISFFSQSQKAKEFRKWVAGLLKAYRQGRLGTGPAARDQLRKIRVQRLFMQEQRKFLAAVGSEASRILAGKGTLEDLEPVPFFQDAVKKAVEKDPRSKQLGIFD